MPLPREAKVGNSTCRIFHEGQYGLKRKECFKCFSSSHFGKNCKAEKCCQICRKPGHSPASSDCEFHVENDGLCVFGGGEDDDFLSNHYECKFEHNRQHSHLFQELLFDIFLCFPGIYIGKNRSVLCVEPLNTQPIS